MVFFQFKDKFTNNINKKLIFNVEIKMSASSIARQATLNQNIPSKRIVIDDPNQLPANYSSTPGGTLFSTTPGGKLCLQKDNKYTRSFRIKEKKKK